MAGEQRRTSRVQDVTDPHGQDLRDFYEVLGQCFPEDELMTFATLQKGLQRNKRMDIAIATVDDVAVGGVIGEWHQQSGVYLASYLAVVQEHWGAGIGSTLIEWLGVQWRRRGATLVLAEVEDPRHYDDAGRYGDPVKRLALYARSGARMLDVRYTLPALEAGSDRVSNLRLITVPLVGTEPDTRQFVPAGTLKTWLRAYVKRSGGESKSDDDTLQELIPDLASTKPIPIVALPPYHSMDR